MEKKDCSFFHEPWEATVGRSPYNSLALPHRGYRLHTSCALNSDVPERQWLKESMCDTRSGSSKLQQQVTGEKWGQKKQVSAGNERKEGGKNAQDYRQKNKRGGGGNSTQMFPKQQLESPALGGTPGDRHLVSVRHQDRLRSKWR